MSKPKTIALVDGFDDGHHLTHLRNYAKVLLEMDCRVLELMPDPSHVQRWLTEVYPAGLDRIRFASFRHPRIESPSWRLRPYWIPWMTWRAAGLALRRAVADTGFTPDLVFFCWLDDYIVGSPTLIRRFLSAVMPFRWSGVYFHPWHLRIPDGPTRDQSIAGERFLRSRLCPSVVVLDHGIVSQLEANIGKPVVPFPDETENGLATGPLPLIDTIKQRAAGRQIIGLVGNLSKRKGVMSLLSAAEQATDRPWLFVFAGTLDANQLKTFTDEEQARLQRAIDGKMPNVFVHPERIDAEPEFNAIVVACDALYAAYELFAHSSGIVTKAGAFRKPVMVSRGFYMEETVRDYQLGLAVDPANTREVVDGLATLLDPQALRQAIGDPGYDAYNGTHSLAALRRGFEQVLRTL